MGRVSDRLNQSPVSPPKNAKPYLSFFAPTSPTKKQVITFYCERCSRPLAQGPLTTCKSCGTTRRKPSTTKREGWCPRWNVWTLKDAKRLRRSGLSSEARRMRPSVVNRLPEKLAGRDAILLTFTESWKKINFQTETYLYPEVQFATQWNESELRRTE